VGCGQRDEALDTSKNAEAGRVAFERTPVVVGVVILLVGAGLFLVWQLAHVVIVLLAGMVVAVILDAGARAISRISGLPNFVSLILVVLSLFSLIAAAGWWGGSTLWTQVSELSLALREVWGSATAMLTKHTGFSPQDVVPSILPQPSAVLGGAEALFSAVGTMLLIIAVGAFFAWDPMAYTRAVVSLLPKSRRHRLFVTMRKAADSMRRWLAGQVVSMCVIFATTWIGLSIIGMPYTLALALLSGLLVFVPTIGPVAAGAIITAAGMTVSPTMAMYGALLYVVIQTLESYLLTPLVQSEAVSLPPAFTLGAQLAFGALFGLVGVAFAVPLAAAGKVLIQELYVEDELGGPWVPPGHSN
jgi:predicted PurR-regulated permease PerM